MDQPQYFSVSLAIHTHQLIVKNTSRSRRCFQKDYGPQISFDGGRTTNHFFFQTLKFVGKVTNPAIRRSFINFHFPMRWNLQAVVLFIEDFRHRLSLGSTLSTKSPHSPSHRSPDGPKHSVQGGLYALDVTDKNLVLALLKNELREFLSHFPSSLRVCQ